MIESIDEEVVMVACGLKHTLFLTENGVVYGAGSNRRHEMGLGNSSQASQSRFLHPLRLQSLEMYMIRSIKAG